MAKITHTTIEPTDELKLDAPVEYVEFDEPLEGFAQVSVSDGLFGEKFYTYETSDGKRFTLTEVDADLISSIWNRNSGPLRIFIHRKNRLGQDSFVCRKHESVKCMSCPSVIPFDRFGGSKDLYYCTECQEDKW